MIEIIAMTEATPITMPSVVRKLRKPCARIDASAICTTHASLHASPAQRDSGTGS